MTLDPCLFYALYLSIASHDIPHNALHLVPLSPCITDGLMAKALGMSSSASPWVLALAWNVLPLALLMAGFLCS